MKSNILVIDDETTVTSLLSKHFENLGKNVITANDGEQGFEYVQKSSPDVIITDLKMPNMDGFEVLEKVKKIRDDVPVIVITGHGEKENAITSLKKGAFDYIEKPFNLETIDSSVEKALEKRRQYQNSKDLLEKLESTNKSLSHDIEVKDRLLETNLEFSEFLGDSPKILEIKDKVTKIMGSESPIVIYGETGTGKGVLAKVIHQHSKRKTKPFVILNCAQFGEQILERELFGFEESSNPNNPHIGLLEAATGGTILIEEIGLMDSKIQANLFKAIQEKAFKRVNGNQFINFDVRFIVASSKDLKTEINAKKFREDLYIYLNVINFNLPKLSERGRDITLLAQYFLRKTARLRGKDIVDFEESTKGEFSTYTWPGNIREMQFLIERAVLLHNSNARQIKINIDTFENPHIPNPNEVDSIPVEIPQDKSYTDIKKDFVNKFEASFLKNILIQNNWNITRTADKLHLDRSNFAKLLKKHKISRPV